MLFARVLRSFVTVGTLRIVDASGRVHVLKGREPGPEATPCASMRVLEKQRLFVTDIEVWRQHYPPTLAAWRQRLHANWKAVKGRFGENFCRMWDFYLASSEAALRQDTFVVFQLQLARRMDAVPLTRDYIEPWKDAHRSTLYKVG